MRGERDALPPCLFSLQGVPARARSSSPFVCSSREGTTRRGKKTFRVRVQCCIAPQGKQTEGRRTGITFPQCEAMEEGGLFFGTTSWLRLILKKALCSVRSDIIHWQEWKQTRV